MGEDEIVLRKGRGLRARLLFDKGRGKLSITRSRKAWGGHFAIGKCIRRGWHHSIRSRIAARMSRGCVFGVEDLLSNMAPGVSRYGGGYSNKPSEPKAFILL